MLYVQILCNLNHSQSQSINKLEDYLENENVLNQVTMTLLYCSTVNDTFQVVFCLQENVLLYFEEYWCSKF